MRHRIIRCLCGVCVPLLAASCAETTRVDNSPGRPTQYVDPDSPAHLAGVGIESQDIVNVTDLMVRDILTCPTIAANAPAARIVVDAQFFRNESTSVVNRNLLTDRLRTELNRAAGGRMVFLARHYADMLQQERALEQNGAVTGGSQGPTKDTLGYDYRLGGRIASLDVIDRRTRIKSRYHQITFELVERGSGVIVWSKTYEFKKLAQDSVLYR